MATNRVGASGAQAAGLYGFRTEPRGDPPGPYVGDPVWTPECNAYDLARWPIIRRVISAGPWGWWLVRLSGQHKDVWIEQDTDPNGENPYWKVDA